MKVVVNWQASVWEPPARRASPPHGRVPDLGGRARPGEREGADQQVRRRLASTEMPDSDGGLGVDPRDVLIAYYRTANAGDWQAWLTLFQEDVVIDEQLAGHVEGLDILRGAIGGMEKGYSRFQNVPKHMVCQGNEARGRLAHLGRQRGRRADRGGGDQLLPVPRTGRSPTWRTSTTRGRSIPSSTRSSTEAWHAWTTTTSSSSAPARPGPRVAARLSEISDVSVLALEAGGEPYPGERHEPGALVHALRLADRLGLPERAAAGARRPADLRAAREDAGRLQQPLHHDAHPRAPVRTTTTGPTTAARAGATTSASPYFQKLEDQEDDTEPDRRQGRPDPRVERRASTTRTRPRRPSSTPAPSSASRRPTTSTAPTWKAPAGTTSTSRTASATDQGGLPRARAIRENLTLQPSTRRRRSCIFEGERCVGVEYVQGRPSWQEARATTEVIVCARRDRIAAAAPALGHRRAAATCGRTGSTPRSTLPGVGENFHNHVLTGVIREGKQQVPTGKQNLSEVALFCKSEPGLAGARPADRASCTCRSTSSSGRTHPNSISILPGVVRPLSRGYDPPVERRPAGASRA